MKRRRHLPLLAVSLLGFLPAAPIAAGGAVESYLVGVNSRGSARGIYLADLGQQPAMVTGPFFAITFGATSRLTMLRDAPAGIIHQGSELHRVDFSNPAVPVLTTSATLPFVINDLARLAAARDELVAVGAGGELVVIDPATLGVRASFTLSSPRSRVRASRDGRLLLTQQVSPNRLFLSAFDPASGSGSEATVVGANLSEAAFSPDGRTVVVLDSFCWGVFQLGPPGCDTYMTVYDISNPASPVSTQKFFPGIDLVTSSVLDRSGERLYFHQRGTYEWGDLPHELLPFDIAGPGELTELAPIELTASGDFEPSGVVRSAGAKELLACTSETDPTDPPVPRLHRYDPATGAIAISPLPVPLEPRGVIHIGADIFADGFESGTTGAWFPADFSRPD